MLFIYSAYYASIQLDLLFNSNFYTFLEHILSNI